jgi:hypothetical protein
MTEKSSRAGEKTAEDDPVPGIKRVVTDHGNKAQRLLRVDQIYSRKDRQVHFVKTAKTKSKPDRFGKTALVVRRIISSKGMVADTEIDVKSEHLARLLKEKYDGITGFKLNKSPPVVRKPLFTHLAICSPWLGGSKALILGISILTSDEGERKSEVRP